MTKRVPLNLLKILAAIIVLAAMVCCGALCESAAGLPTDEMPWSVWEFTLAVDNAGSEYSPEKLGHEMYLCLNRDNTGFLYTGDAVSWLSWSEDSDWLVLTCDDHKLYLSFDDKGNLFYTVNYPGTLYITLSSDVFFSPAQKLDASKKYIGEWIISGTDGDFSGLSTETTLILDENSTARQDSELGMLAKSLLGDDYSNLGNWIVLGDKLFISNGNHKDVSLYSFDVSGNTIAISPVEISASAQFLADIPMNMEDPRLFEYWSGLWYSEDNTDGLYSVYSLDLSKNGTAFFTHANTLDDPDIIHSFEGFFWIPSENGITLAKGNSESRELKYLSGGLRYEDNAGLAITLKPIEKNYSVLQESAKANKRTLKDYLGVWDARSIPSGDVAIDVQIILEPDSGAVLRMVTRTDDPREAQHTEDKNCSWRFTEDGISLYSGTEDQEAIEIPFVNGMPTIEGSPLTLSHPASDWNGESYGETVLADYMTTGYVGIWKNASSLDNFSDEFFHLCLGADGKGELILDNREDQTYPLIWHPVEGGFAFSSSLEMRPFIMDAGEWAEITKDSYTQSMEWDTRNHGIVGVKKINDYWSDGSTAVSAPIVKYADNGDGTITITDYLDEAADISLPAEIDGMKVTAIGDNLFAGNIAITSIVIPEGVERIGNNAFDNCSALEYVQLPESLIHIGNNAFSKCQQLKDVYLSAALTYIGSSAFYECTSLESLRLDGNGLEIGSSAFAYCTGISSLEIGPGIAVIGDSAFTSCRNITALTIPATISRIGTAAFSYLSELETLTLEEGLAAIGAGAFEYCSSLTSVYIPGSISEIPAEAFNKCSGLESLEIAEGVTVIGNSAFYGCEKLHTVVLPESLQEIGELAFSALPSLEAISLPAGVTHIGRCAFGYNEHLKNVVLPEGLVSLGEYAFADCTRLQSLYVPETVAEIGKYILGYGDTLLLGGANIQAYAESYGYAYQQVSHEEAESNSGSYGTFLPETDETGTVDDSEQSLRYLLFDATGQKDFDEFVYGDFDGDGVHEAFALITENYYSDIWFVSNHTTKAIQEDKSYYYLMAEGESAPYVITAEEGYGGSGSTMHMWMVSDGEPHKINVDLYGGMSYGGNGVFYAYPSAFDGWTDGTGHTWKRYYYYMDGDSFKEYGGIYITLADLLKFDGAKEILDGVQNEGYTILDIIYRENNIINVNLRRDSVNDNLTLQYDESSVIDLGERYGGTYSLANSPDDATYPAAFIEPTGISALSTPVPSSTLPPASGAKELIAENLTFSIYKKPLTNVESIVALSAFNADGSRKAEIELFNYYEEFPEYTDFGMQLYRLSDGWYYAESWFLFEGIQRHYILLRLDDDRFTIEQIVEDPGYSDGFGLRDPYTYSDYYYAEGGNEIAPTVMTSLLNDMFAGHGLTFEWPVAIAIDGELLLDLSKGDLGFQSAPAASEPATGTTGKQDVAASLGVFNYNALRHVRKVDHTTEQGIEDYKVWLNDDVYYGGSDGYIEDWLTSDGIFAEMDVDLDGDGTDEYAVLYHKAIPIDYDFQEHEYHLAVYERENGGYRLAADAPINYDLMGMESERFARSVSGPRGLRILTGYIAFWEGGGGGVTGYMYGYDGSEIYCDLIIGATTDSRSFVVNHRVPAKEAYEIRCMCEFYEENSSELEAYGIVHGQNLHTVDFYLWEKSNPYTYMKADRFEGIALAADFAKDYGVDIRAEIHSDNYKLYCDGGDTLSESAEEWSSGNAYVHIRNLTSLEHFASGSTGTTTSGNSGAASTGDTVTTGTVRITGSVNLRSGPGTGYKKVSSAEKGKKLPYLGETVYDDRSPAVAWYKVERNNGEVAWVSEKYAVLEGVKEVPATQAPEITAAPTATPTPAPIVTGTVKTTASANLRSGPGLGYGKVSDAKKGKTFTYLGETVYDDRTPPVAWYKIQLKDGSAAWISSKYAKLTETSGSTVSTFASLAKGSKGDRVVELQEMLAYLGYHTGSVDGDYGNQTVKSVTAFQSAYGLEATGTVNEKTWNAICEAVGR